MCLRVAGTRQVELVDRRAGEPAAGKLQFQPGRLFTAGIDVGLELHTVDAVCLVTQIKAGQLRR